MVITKTVKLSINNCVKKRYLDLGYKIPKDKNSVIEVKVEDLTKGCNIKIQCECDICEKITKLKYYSYLINIGKYGYYTCVKCSDIKKKKTKLEKYGDANYINLNKMKQTCLKKYGVSHPHKLKSIRKKYEKTCLEKYGVKSTFQCDMVKKKIKITNNIRYGVDNPTQNTDILLKSLKNGYKIKQFNNKIYYQGTYELDFLKKYYDLGVERANSIKYPFNNKIMIYHPDFYLKEHNLIVEIKSTYIYNLHYDKNIAKEKECLKQGFNYILILDKNYDEFTKIIN